MIRLMERYGRICLPHNVRKALELKENDLVEISLREDSVVIRKCRQRCPHCGSSLTPEGRCAICGRSVLGEEE